MLCSPPQVINVSSPNTPGLRKLQGRRELHDLIKKVRRSAPLSSPHSAQAACCFVLAAIRWILSLQDCTGVDLSLLLSFAWLSSGPLAMPPVPPELASSLTLSQIVSARNEMQWGEKGPPPLLVKVAPDLSAQDMADIAAVRGAPLRGSGC